MPTVNVLLTNAGLSALASALGGGYTPPLYLVIDSKAAKLVNAYAPGVMSIQTDIVIDQPGDTNLVLSPGLATQEIVPFSGRSGSGPITYTLTAPTTQSHALNDPVLRQVSVTDTLAQIGTEVVADPVNLPGGRLPVTAGLAPGIGQWTLQFFLNSVQGNVFIAQIGLSDSPTVGAGTLHAIGWLGVDHTPTTNDLEIDVTPTIINN